MDDSETLARAYLVHLGFTDIRYEPDGNVPPDFLVNGRIAVEVRRLNQNELTSSIPRGLEETRVPFQMSLRKLLMSMGPPRFGVSWFLRYSIRRPLPDRHAFSSALRRFLHEFQKDERNQEPCCVVLENVEIKLTRAGDKYPTLFLLGGGIDEDTGGWTLSETKKNLRICLDEKRAKVKPFRHKYPQWWLILIDRIGYGVNECDRELFSQHLQMKDDWDKVVLLNPFDTLSAFELPSGD